MNHLPFRDWLLSEESLTEEQQQVFQEHLNNCAECRQAQASWGEIHSLIQRTPQLSPREGFVERWELSMAARRAKRQRIQIGLTLFGGVIMVVGILILLSSQFSIVFHSPTQFIMMCVAQLASLFVLLSSVKDYLIMFFNNFPLLPLIGLVLGVGITSLLGVLWLTAYQQLIVARRFVK